MKKTWRTLLMVLALSLALALAGCGGDKDDAAADEDAAPQVEENVQEEETPEAEDAETEEEAEEAETPEETPAEKPEAKPAEKPAAKPAEKPAAKPAQKPAAKPAEKPAQKPAEKPAQKSVDLTAFYNSIEGMVGTDNWPAMGEMSGETLDAFYPGLSGISKKQCVVNSAMISAVVGEIALVEVNNSADVQKVKDIFQARINYQVGDDSNPGAAMYPATIEGWKNSSRIVSHGNYVMLVAYEGYAPTIVKGFQNLFA